MQTKTFEHLQVGDKVTRLLSSAKIPMPLFVIATMDDLVTCSLDMAITDPGSCWTFDVVTGVEIDEDLGWGPAYGLSGSRLEHNNEKAN